MAAAKLNEMAGVERDMEAPISCPPSRITQKQQNQNVNDNNNNGGKKEKNRGRRKRKSKA